MMLLEVSRRRGGVFFVGGWWFRCVAVLGVGLGLLQF